MLKAEPHYVEYVKNNVDCNVNKINALFIVETKYAQFTSETI